MTRPSARTAATLAPPTDGIALRPLRSPHVRAADPNAPPACVLAGTVRLPKSRACTPGPLDADGLCARCGANLAIVLETASQQARAYRVRVPRVGE